MRLTELSPITTRFYKGETSQHIQARKLHSFLEVGKDFSTWIKDRIAEYGFTETVKNDLPKRSSLYRKGIFCPINLLSKENDYSPKSGGKKLTF